jgi:mercuric ion binding protein
MKTILALLLVASATFASWASAATIELDVNGLVCAFCAQGIEKTLKKFPATDGVFVSLENRVVAVELKDGGTIEDEALRSAITNSGYTVVAIRRTDESLDALRTRVAAAHDGKSHD